MTRKAERGAGSSRLVSTCCLAAAAALAGCETAIQAPEFPPPPARATWVHVPDTAVAGEWLPSELAVEVVDSAGRPVEDIQIAWSVTWYGEGGGYGLRGQYLGAAFSSPTSRTDGYGVARVQLRLGEPLGRYRIRARWPYGPDNSVSDSIEAVPSVRATCCHEIHDIAPPPYPLGWAHVATDAERILVFGGVRTHFPETSAPDSILAYDLATGTWAALPAAPRWPRAAAYHDGYFYVLADTTFHRLDAASWTWTRLSGPPEPIWSGEFFEVSDTLYAVGREHVHAYLPEEDRWASHAGGTEEPRGAVVGIDDGKLIVIGGESPESVELVHPVTGARERLPDLPFHRTGAAAFQIDGSICISGGTYVALRSGQYFAFTLRGTHCLPPGGSAWEQGPPLPAAYAGLSPVAVGDVVYLIGAGTYPFQTTELRSADRRSFVVRPR